MFTIVEPPKEFATLNDRCRDLVVEIIANLDITAESFKLRSDTPLYDEGQSKKYVYVVREGNLAYTLNQRTLFYFQEGDLIGFERELDVFTPHIVSDFATILDRYPVEDFLKSVHRSTAIATLWQEFLGRYIAALYVVARSLFKDAEPILPEVRSYPEGSVIIEQGTTGDEIFTMADGLGSITKDGTQFGSISSDEIFGLYGSLTNTPRIASVIAETDCLVLVMKKKSYLELLLTRPKVLDAVLLDMAHVVVQGERQLAGMTLKL